MSDSKENFKVIELLREKTEEIDLKQYLKSTLGGYTKKSVLGYLTILKKQQQDTAETFHQNLQALFAEKENLKKNNQILQERLTKTENEYKSLHESLLVLDLENKAYSVQDVIDLKKNISAQESELNRIKDVNCDLNQKISQLNESIKDLSRELEQSRQETQTQKDLLVSEKLEMKKQCEKIIELTNTLGANRDEIKYLKSAVSEANIAEMQNNIASLMAQIATQAEMIKNYHAENTLKEQTIQTLTGENESIKKNIGGLSKTLESLNERNDKLLFANGALKNMLEEEYKKEIALISEKSDTVIEKLAANKKFDEANAKISILEMQIEQYKKQELSPPQS